MRWNGWWYGGMVWVVVAACASESELVGSWPAWRMPDSATVYCTDADGPALCPEPGSALHGQDGTYQVNMPSFDTATSGVVVDSVTGLMWERNAPTDLFTWAEAKAYCDSLKLAGLEHWRLPSRIELISIVDYGRSGPTIDEDIFPTAVTKGDGLSPAAKFWTSSKAQHRNSAWVVHFSNGTVSGSDTSAAWPGRARCVRSTSMEGGQ